MSPRPRVTEAELESLQRSEQRFRSTLDGMIEGCQILGRDWRYLYLNPAAEAQSRRAPGSLIGQRFMDAWPGVESTELFVRIQRSLEDRIADRFENEFEFPDGTSGWFELRIEPVDEGVLILSADISERHASEERIRHLNRVLHAITRINHLIVREKDTGALIQRICETLVAARSDAAVWIALVGPDGTPAQVAEAGFGESFATFRQRFDAGWRPACWSEARADSAAPGLVALDPGRTCRGCPLERGGGSGTAAVAPLRHAGRDFGSLGIWFAPGADSDRDEVALLCEVADDLALALHARRLDRERAAYAQMVANNRDGIALVSRDHRYLDVNPSHARMLGVSPAGLIGRHLAEVLGDEFFEREVRPHVDACFEGRILESLGTRDVPGLGPRTAEVLYTPSRDPDGTVVAVAITLRDVTERLQAEALLRESERRLSVIFGRSPVGIVLSRLDDGRIVDVNPAIAELFGWHPEELIGRTAVEVGVWAEASQRGEMSRQLRETGACRDFEIVARRRDGAPRTVRLNAESIEFAGEPHLLGVLEDITDRKEAEARRGQLEDQLRATQKMEAIGTLAGGVAHDFNNLLVVILNCTDFALDALPEDSAPRADLLEVKDAAERAVALTRQLLAFGRKQVLQPEPLALDRVVEGLARMLRRILGEDIELVLDLAPDAGVVMADPGQLEQVLMNLVTNARDAMPEGGRLTIGTANVELDARRTAGIAGTVPGRYVELRVTDTGRGMDAATQARVFEPFFTTKEKGRGTGLGLATVYGIVKQSGGYIWLESAPGQGTTVRVDLPRVEDVVPGAAPAPARLPARGSETVLVVEDEQGVRELVRRSLTAAGHRVRVAASHDEALAICDTLDAPVDLLITDVVMPRISGRRVAQDLLARWPGLRVLYMSGYTDDAIARHGVIEPGTNFLAKPFTIGGLLSRVREVLDTPPPAPPA